MSTIINSILDAIAWAKRSNLGIKFFNKHAFYCQVEKSPGTETDLPKDELCLHIKVDATQKKEHIRKAGASLSPEDLEAIISKVDKSLPVVVTVFALVGGRTFPLTVDDITLDKTSQFVVKKQ